jgi:hypothetical protein
MDKPRNNETPTIVIFLNFPDSPYCNVERPNAVLRAQMKHSTDAAKACGIEARRAHTFPIRKTKILKNRLIFYF